MLPKLNSIVGPKRKREQANKFSGENNGAWHPKNVRNRALQCHTSRLDWKWTWPIPHLNRDFAKCVVGRYLNHASVKNIRDKSESSWRRFSNTGVAIPFSDDLIWGASSLQPWNRTGIDETQCGFKSIDDSTRIIRALARFTVFIPSKMIRRTVVPRFEFHALKFRGVALSSFRIEIELKKFYEAR